MSDREKFEAWARTDEGNCADYDLARKTAPWTDEYRNDLVQRDWEIWQARAALTAEKVAGQEAVAWMVLAANTRKPCEVTLHKSETEALRQDCVIPLYAAPQPSQPAQSGEHCVNCGASVDPLCACERGRKLAAQSGEQDERAAHCVNTCNFYNKNRPCECPAPQSDAAAWEAIFDRVALELNCLPSSSPDGNEHVFHAIAKLRAASTQPVQDERAEVSPIVAPYAECSFRICDLPGQCRSEGKCHHPRAVSAQSVAQTAESRASILEKAAALCDQLAEEFPNGAARLCANSLRRFNEQLDKKETRQ